MSAALTQEQADDLFDALQADIEAAAAEEAELELVLTRLEALILEDILAGTYADEGTNDNRSLSRSGTPSPVAATPSTTSKFGIATTPDETGQETFIQQKSLALLPLLCRFPLFTSSASERVINLIVLVSKRLNPKELWFGLDSVVETSRVGLEGLADLLNYEKEENDGDEEASESVDCSLDCDEPPEYISIYLSRALIAMQIVLPRINVKKPEKYLKPVLDTLTGCFIAIETPDLRDHILDFQEFEFAGTLLLVNTARVVVTAWTWAQSMQKECDTTLQLALRRLYLLAVGCLLPLCPEASMVFSPASGETELRLASLRRPLLEPCLPLDIHSLRDLEKSFAAPELMKCHASELHKHRQRTVSYTMLAAIMTNYMENKEEQSRTILSFLPGLFKHIMEEDIDPLLRTVLIYASLSLGEAASENMASRWGEGQVRDESIGTSVFEGIGAVLQVLIDHFGEIEQLPSLGGAHGPPRKVLTLCQHLLSDTRLETPERDELITRILKAENTHIRTAGVTALRTFVVAEEMGLPSDFLSTLLPKFGVHLFDRQQLSAEVLLDPQIQDWLMCLLNFIYVVNARRGPTLEEDEHPTKVRFLTHLRMILEAASTQAEPIVEMLAGSASDKEQLPEVRSRLQLEILKDAFERASHSQIVRMM